MLVPLGVCGAWQHACIALEAMALDVQVPAQASEGPATANGQHTSGMEA
ncbi:hypothetical protein [Halochromatium sp.]